MSGRIFRHAEKQGKRRRRDQKLELGLKVKKIFGVGSPGAGGNIAKNDRGTGLAAFSGTTI